MHDIGKNLVKMMIEGQGIECVDLGVDVGPEQVVSAVRETGAKLVCLSALLTTTMMGQKEIIDALIEAGLRDQVKLMVGGAPITQQFADEIGADCYALDAASAAMAARAFFEE
jgi:5-methyltetrahydrofolate--homocysteine methyltransferase